MGIDTLRRTRKRAECRTKYGTEIRQLACETRVIEYCLTRKAVKNINLRIRPDGRVCVSAHPLVPAERIDAFVKEKQSFIFRALDQVEENRRNAALAPRENHREEIFTQICREIYPLFEKEQIPYPALKIRSMTSCWGVCHPKKGSITLNRHLLEIPRRCIEYVVLHELAHFIHPNHSRQFYDLLTERMPDWRERREELGKYAWELESRK